MARPRGDTVRPREEAGAAMPRRQEEQAADSAPGPGRLTHSERVREREAAAGRPPLLGWASAAPDCWSRRSGVGPWHFRRLGAGRDRRPSAGRDVCALSGRVPRTSERCSFINNRRVGRNRENTDVCMRQRKAMSAPAGVPLGGGGPAATAPCRGAPRTGRAGTGRTYGPRVRDPVVQSELDPGRALVHALPDPARVRELWRGDGR